VQIRRQRLADNHQKPGNSRKGRRLPFLLVLLAAIGLLIYLERGFLEKIVFNRSGEETVSFLQLTDQPGTEYFPSLSPNGKNFVYAASRTESNSDIMLARVGGKIPVDLTSDCLEDDTQPAFSPDGERIAFRSERMGGGIYVMGAAGEPARRLTNFGYNPAWSPDGRHILVATESITRPEDRAATGSMLWIIDYPSGVKHLLYRGDAVQPQWSPSGKRVAFWAIDSKGGRDIWTIPAAITEGKDPQPVRVTNVGFINWDPVWSPKGNALYFSSDRSGTMSLWLVPVDEESGQVLGKPQIVPAPSPDSSQISLSENARKLAYVQYSFVADIFKVHFDPESEIATGEPIQITHGSRPVTRPALSPDGQWLAFNTWSKQEDLFIVRTNGSGLRELTNDVYQDRGPRWSPDGKELAFFSNRSGKYEVWTIGFDGDRLHQVTNHPEHMVVSPVWAPDGRHLACSIYGIRSFIMNLQNPGAGEKPLNVFVPNFSGYFQVWSWSRDGKKLAGYLINPDGSAAGIGIYFLQSDTFERLTDYGMDPVWLSDDRRLLFYNNGRLDLVHSETKKSHSVLSVAPHSIAKRGFAVSSDDSLIYFSQTSTESNIWLRVVGD
jgi:Tol biopolymer transport system component